VLGDGVHTIHQSIGHRSVDPSRHINHWKGDWSIIRSGKQTPIGWFPVPNSIAQKAITHPGWQSAKWAPNRILTPKKRFGQPPNRMQWLCRGNWSRIWTQHSHRCRDTDTDAEMPEQQAGKLGPEQTCYGSKPKAEFKSGFESNSKMTSYCEISEIAPIPVQRAPIHRQLPEQESAPTPPRVRVRIRVQELAARSWNPDPRADLSSSSFSAVRCACDVYGKTLRTTPSYPDTGVTVAWPLHTSDALYAHTCRLARTRTCPMRMRVDWLRPRVSKYLTDFQYGRRFDSSYCCCCASVSVSALCLL